MACKMWHGDADPEVHWQGARSLAQQLGGMELQIVPGAGHHLLLCHWQTVFEGLKAMLRQTADERVAALA
jgi:surfactin synthase thioesterase subunit